MFWLAALTLSLYLHLPLELGAHPVGSAQEPGEAPRADQDQQRPRQEPQQAQKPPNTAAPSTSVLDDIVSIEHIKKELERRPSLSFTQPDPNVPRFRIEVQGQRFRTPTLAEMLDLRKSTVPQPFGGSDYYEMKRLTTPPQFWGSAPFTNTDLLGMSALSGAYGLLGALVKAGLDARDTAVVARARREVQEELAALAEVNRRAAEQRATEANGQAAEKKDPKKQDPKKKDPKKKES